MLSERKKFRLERSAPGIASNQSFTVVCIGSVGVGKRTFVQRYITKNYAPLAKSPASLIQLPSPHVDGYARNSTLFGDKGEIESLREAISDSNKIPETGTGGTMGFLSLIPKKVGPDPPAGSSGANKSTFLKVSRDPNRDPKIVENFQKIGNSRVNIENKNSDSPSGSPSVTKNRAVTEANRSSPIRRKSTNDLNDPDSIDSSIVADLPPPLPTSSSFTLSPKSKRAALVGSSNKVPTEPGETMGFLSMIGDKSSPNSLNKPVAHKSGSISPTFLPPPTLSNLGYPPPIPVSPSNSLPSSPSTPSRSRLTNTNQEKKSCLDPENSWSSQGGDPVGFLSFTGDKPPGSVPSSPSSRRNKPPILTLPRSNLSGNRETIVIGDRSSPFQPTVNNTNTGGETVGFLSLIGDKPPTPTASPTTPNKSPTITGGAGGKETVGFLSLIGDKPPTTPTGSSKLKDTMGFLSYIGDKPPASPNLNTSTSSEESCGETVGFLSLIGDQPKFQPRNKKQPLAKGESKTIIDDQEVQFTFQIVTNLGDDKAVANINEGDGFLFMFSLTSKESFESVRVLLKLFFTICAGNDKKAFLLVGTMCDDEEGVVVLDKDALALARQYRINYCKCSAKENIHIDKAMNDIFSQMEFERFYLTQWRLIRDEFKDKLSNCVISNQINKAKVLLTQGSLPSTINKFGWAPIHIACWDNNIEFVYLFLQFEPACVNIPNKIGWSPLHCASRMGNIKIVNLLLQSGANVIMKDFNKKLGVNTRFIDVRELLIKKIESRQRLITLQSCDNFYPDHLSKEIQLSTKTGEAELSYCGITKIPPLLEQSMFESITRLYLIGNQISEFPMEICKLVNLVGLYLYSNELTYLPEELSQLGLLQILDVRMNRLTAVCASIGSMKSLTELYLSHNCLSFLPSQICDIEKSLKFFDVYQNPLNSIPVDVLPKLGDYSPSDMPQLFAYLRSITLGGEVEYNRVKIMFVGEGNVGKTSLINCFHEKDKKKAKASKSLHKVAEKEPTETIATDGIDIHDITIPIPNTQREMIWDCWDYAGQEIYYTTHQFFITQRSIYLICFNLLDRNMPKVEYWLNSIHTRARGSPMILVGTHCDDKDCTTEYVQAYIDQLIKTLKPERFKSSLGIQSVKGIYTVSSKRRIGIKELMDGITDVAIKNQYVGKYFPLSWLKLESTITTLRLNKLKPFMKWDEFHRVAVGCNLEADAIKEVVKFLHSTGVLCYFDDSNNDLNDLVILDPQFLTNVMASVVTLKHRYGQDARCEGLLNYQDLPQIWKDFPLDIHETLMKLLEQFEIAFKLPEGNYIIPSLLPLDQPDTAKLHWSVSIGQKVEGYVFSREYNFGFLPLGFFSRLFIRNWHLPNFEVKTHWRNGQILVFDNDENIVSLLRYNPSSYRLMLDVHCKIKEPTQDELSKAIKILRVLIENIETTIEGWYETTVEKFVPCSHCLRTGGYSQWKFKEEQCMEAVADGFGFVLCRNVRKIRIDYLAPDLSFTDLKKLQIPFNELEMESVIGEGAFGTVSKASLRGELVAVKQLSLVAPIPSGNNPLMQEIENFNDSEDGGNELVMKFNEFQREVWLMSCLNHKNVCGLKGICANPMAIVMDYLPMGDLFHIIGEESSNSKEPIKFKEEREKLKSFELKLKLILDIARGMKHLHSYSPIIIHRDLRSPNIFVDNLDCSSRFRVKIGDFGLSRLLSATLIGGEFNANWLAPEVMKQNQYTSKIDVYSFGIIMWEILTLARPFAEYDDRFSGKPAAIFKAAVIEGLRPTFTANEQTAEYCNLMERCWDDNPDLRPDFPEIVIFIKKLLSDNQFVIYESDDESTSPRDGSDSQQGQLTAISPRAVPFLKRHKLDHTLSIDQLTIGFLHNKLDPGAPHSILSIVEAWHSKTVWSANSAGFITVWDLLSLTQIKTLKITKERIYSMVTVEDNIWIGCTAGKIFVYNFKDYKKQATLKDPNKNTIKAMLPFTVTTQQKGKSKVTNIVATGDVEGNLIIWKIRKRAKPKIKQKIKVAQFISCMIDFDQSTICIGTESLILLFDKNTLSVKGQWTGHSNLVNCMVKYADNVWSGSNDGTIRIWALGSNESISEPLQAHTSKILTITTIQNCVWTGSFDMSIAIWDPLTKTLIQEIKEHQDSVRSMCTLSNNKYVWSGGSENDAKICIWYCRNAKSRNSRASSHPPKGVNIVK